MTRVRVGVVGVGVIGQVMHLHYLRELADRCEIAAVCDLSIDAARACAERYGVEAVYTDWREMISSDLDAVLILTSGSHAPLAVEAARRGLHVFVEKPMCFSTAEATEMIDAADAAGVTLMVGYPKRYDPAFARFAELASDVGEPLLLRVTTTEAPWRPYLSHYPLVGPGAVDADVLAGLRADSAARLAGAIGTDDEELVSLYSNVLLDTLVHEVNTVRGVWGEPERLEHVDVRPGSLNVLLSYGGAAAAIHWLDVPRMTRYAMEFSLTGRDARATLTFPSPYLRNAPTSLVLERGSSDSVASSRVSEVVSYESGFKNELVAFFDAVTSGAPLPTDGRDAARDVAMCQSIIASWRAHAPVERPTDY
ncbi:MAG: Gfo/Idh/MocA family protein [Acidimicrobiales bacterium]